MQMCDINVGDLFVYNYSNEFWMVEIINKHSNTVKVSYVIVPKQHNYYVNKEHEYGVPMGCHWTRVYIETKAK